MKKQSWTKKPVTWGALAMFVAISSAISLIGCAGYYLVLAEPDWWKSLKKFIRSLYRKTFYKRIFIK